MTNAADLTEFLSESNAIEGVYNQASLSQAMLAWEYLISKKKMTVEVVKKTHSILMTGHLRGKERGEFRQRAVWIGGKEAMYYSSIPSEMKVWCDMMNGKSAYPEEWKRLHVDYERIHPFIDGNGRTGRMFMNWYRLKQGMSLLTIHEGREQMSYYDWFKTGLQKMQEEMVTLCGCTGQVVWATGKHQEGCYKRTEE